VSTTSERYLNVVNTVPFDSSIYWQLHTAPYDLDFWVSDSRRFESAYLRWETVRKTKNPFFTEGTGFEGYFVGIDLSPEAVLERLLAIGHAILESITRQYRLEYGFKGHLMKTLYGEDSDFKAMEIWSTQLGAALGRLRCNLNHNPQAEHYRTVIANTVDNLPPMRYQEANHHIEQTYSLALPDAMADHNLTINAHNVRRTDQDAWLVAERIGRFGHPLVREFVRYAY
jgi:hypothetical protein